MSFAIRVCIALTWSLIVGTIIVAAGSLILMGILFAASFGVGMALAE